MEILERSNDPSLTNISQHGNHALAISRVPVSVGNSTVASAAASNASGSSIAEGSGGGGRDSLERVTEGVASTEYFRDGAGISASSSPGVGTLTFLGYSLSGGDVSPGSVSPARTEPQSPESPVDTMGGSGGGER